MLMYLIQKYLIHVTKCKTPGTGVIMMLNYSIRWGIFAEVFNLLLALCLEAIHNGAQGTMWS